MYFCFQKRIFVDPFVNKCDPVEVDMLYHQSVTDVFEEKIPLTKSDAVSCRSKIYHWLQQNYLNKHK